MASWMVYWTQVWGAGVVRPRGWCHMLFRTLLMFAKCVHVCLPDVRLLRSRLLTRCLPIAFTFEIFFENFKMFVWPSKMQFGQSCQKFTAKSPIFFQKKSENIHKFIISSKKVFLKKFLRTCRMQIRQPCRTFVARSPKNSKLFNFLKIKAEIFLLNTLKRVLKIPFFP